MSEIKFWINRREPGMQELADKMREAGIDFSTHPTSGATVLWHGTRTFHGPTAVKHAVEVLIKQLKEEENELPGNPPVRQDP